MSRSDAPIHAVTGGFGYSGKYITRRLLDAGCRVRTLTNASPERNCFGDAVSVHRFNFDNPKALVASLEGVAVLYNTYWIRFGWRGFTYEDALKNTLAMFAAARIAGVKRIVHVSITNPSATSPSGYFRGKAQAEESLKETGISHAILRPTVLFGKEDILINNIAWMLRRMPVLGIFGDGRYRLQPIYVDDLAQLAVEQGKGRDNVVIDAIGPETFTYRQLVEQIGRIIGKNRPMVSVPPWFGYLGATAMGWLLRDVIVTRQEIQGLMEERLYVDSPPAGDTKLTDWATQHAATLGTHYASELARRRRNV